MPSLKDMDMAHIEGVYNAYLMMLQGYLREFGVRFPHDVRRWPRTNVIATSTLARMSNSRFHWTKWRYRACWRTVNQGVLVTVFVRRSALISAERRQPAATIGTMARPVSRLRTCLDGGEKAVAAEMREEINRALASDVGFGGLHSSFRILFQPHSSPTSTFLLMFSEPTLSSRHNIFLTF